MEMREMGDAHDAMLCLSTELAEKKAAGQHLSAHEQIIADITWIDIQVAPNGFEGWLYYTSNECIQRTLAALDRIGCARVAELVKKALVVAAIDLLKMSNSDREARLDTLSETDRRGLFELDHEFYDAVDDCMERLRSFVNA
jgi:hypothetical protein